MTDETRAELRRDIGHVVRMAGLPMAYCFPAGVAHDNLIGSYRSIAAGVVVPINVIESAGPLPEPPPLTPFQQMCLAGLLGDPAQLESAVVDYLLDQGHEYATAVRDAERARCTMLVDALRAKLPLSGDLRRLREDISQTRAPDMFSYLTHPPQPSID